jgi:hypothetical protein
MKIYELFESVSAGVTSTASVGANTPIAKNNTTGVVNRTGMSKASKKKTAPNALDQKGNLLA